MTQQEILDYNKRCAEFLGYKYSEFYEEWNEYYEFWESQNDGVWYKESDLIGTPESFRQYYVKVNGLFLKEYHYSLKFDSDWNWIHEVVEAIEKLGFYTKILDNGMSIEKEGTLQLERWGETKKLGTIQTINEFLIWYNNEQRT